MSGTKQHFCENSLDMYSRHAGMSRAGSPHDAASICLVSSE